MQFLLSAAQAEDNNKDIFIDKMVGWGEWMLVGLFTARGVRPRHRLVKS